MFDAKKLLDAMVAGTSPAAAPGQGGFGDLMNQMAQRMAPGDAGRPAGGSAPQSGGLGDLLGQMMGQDTQSGNNRPSAAGAQQSGGLGDMLGQMLGKDSQPGATGASGDLGSVFGQVLDKMKGAAEQARGPATDMAGNIAGKAKDMFGKATTGVGDAARDFDQQTGAAGKLDDLIKQMSGGQSAGDLLARAQDLVKNNPAASGALAGALGALVLGTRSGRGVAMDAAKLGGLVLISGLAYKAWRNYQDGQSTTASSTGGAQAAPLGSGFDAAQSNDNAVTYLRAMIAAAAVDGQITDAERSRIIGGLGQLGLDADAHQFLDQEFARPASIAELAASASSPEAAAQIYSAARLVIEPDSNVERQFLAELAGALGLDPALAAHIDAAATSVRS